MRPLRLEIYRKALKILRLRRYCPGSCPESHNPYTLGFWGFGTTPQSPRPETSRNHILGLWDDHTVQVHDERFPFADEFAGFDHRVPRTPESVLGPPGVFPRFAQVG